MDNILSLSVRAQNKGLLRAIIWLLIAAGLFVVPVSLSAQGHICSGTVSDSDGNPVPGAFVLIQGTQDGTSTDENGEFSLTVPAGATLEFSCLGYKTVTTEPGDRAVINVILEDDMTSLDEVVVIGYGTTTRRRSVGAVDQVKSEVLETRSVANLTQALQGTSPSLVIQQRSFNPNDQQLNINIRGIGTMNNNDPLIVIDGLVTDNSAFSKLNPQDIESVSVLKDAGTAAIYGSRAANGVLLVTTKKGQKNQAPQVNLSAMLGWQVPYSMFRPVEGWQNATLLNTARANANLDPSFTSEQIRDLYENGNGTWYFDEIMQTALQQNYNVSVSGGSANTTYMVSAGYFDQGSNFIGPDYGVKRYNVRANVATDYKRVKFTALLSYNRSDSRNTVDSNAIPNSTRIPTYYYYRQQDPETGRYLVNDLLTDFNSLGLLKDGGYDKYNNDYINANASLEVKIIEGLKLRGTLGADIYSNHRYTRTFTTEFYNYQDIDGEPRLNNTDRRSEDWNEKSWLINSQIMLDFDRTFAEKHHVYALLGASNESYTRQGNQIRILRVDDELGIQGSDSEIDTGGSYITPESTTRTSLTSVFGRIGYDYAEKYFIEGTFRYDGSSKFASDYRWGFFPSVSAGWSISEEPWMAEWNQKMGLLKIRASYGTLGNQAVSDYQYFTTYDVYTNTYGFNNVAVAGAGFQLGTDNLQWEVSKTLNVGFDAGFFKNSLTIGFDYFNKHTTDILITPETPLHLGTTLNSYNAGEMRTQGWELTVNWSRFTDDWTHNLTFNIGDSWNRVLHFEGYEQISQSDEIYRIIREGLPLYSYFGYKTDGFFQSYEEIENSALPAGMSGQLHPGDVKYVDQNGDGVINENDRVYLGNAFPRYTFGLNYAVSWKGIDLSIMFQGVLKRDMMLRGELVEPFHENYGYTMYTHQLDYWTPTNTDARWPRLTYTSAQSEQNNYGYCSDIQMFNASYLRLKDLQIGYTFPKKWMDKVGIEKLRIYFDAQNLFTVSGISFLDPESSEFGNSMNAGGANSGRNYPNLRYFGMGLDFTF